jgi:hypothetical protein
MRESERNYDRRLQLERDVERLAAQNGLLSYRLRAQAEAHRDHMGRALRKISRQARVIRRLEERLRALNARPYEDAPMGETAPAVEHDVEHGDA